MEATVKYMRRGLEGTGGASRRNGRSRAEATVEGMRRDGRKISRGNEASRRKDYQSRESQTNSRVLEGGRKISRGNEGASRRKENQSRE
jgi:hypothetical protein